MKFAAKVLNFDWDFTDLEERFHRFDFGITLGDYTDLNVDYTDLS